MIGSYEKVSKLLTCRGSLYFNIVQPPVPARLISEQSSRPLTATLTDPFLDFTASRRNDLRSIGLTSGSKWCLCAGRWKEALEYAQKPKSSDKAFASIVPKVHLHATHDKALDVVSYEELKKHAAEPEAANSSNVAQNTEGGHAGAIGERTELEGKGDLHWGEK